MRIDLWSTPNVSEIYTPAIRAGGLLRMNGARIDGGVDGEPLASLELKREGSTQQISCRTRDDGGDAVAYT